MELLPFTLIYISYVYLGLALFYERQVPESISATSYIYKDIFKVDYIFTAYCIFVASLLLPSWLTVSPDNLQFLVFICCAGILCAGTTPLFKEADQGKIHYAGGIIAFIGFVLWMLCSHNYYWLLADAICILLLVCLDRKNYVFYAETCSLFTLNSYLFHTLINC